MLYAWETLYLPKQYEELTVITTAQLHAAFHPQDSKKGLKIDILYKRAQTHMIGRIHTYITLSTSLMKVECRGRCFPAACRSPSSSLGQEAEDTRSKRNCRKNPGRENPILPIGIRPNTWSTLHIIAYAKRLNEGEWQASISIREAMLFPQRFGTRNAPLYLRHRCCTHSPHPSPIKSML